MSDSSERVVTVGGNRRISLQDVLKVASFGYAVAVDPSILEKCKSSANLNKIKSEVAKKSASNLFPVEVSRAAVFAKLTSFALGHNISASVLTCLVKALNDNVVPAFYNESTAGAVLLAFVRGDKVDCYKNGVFEPNIVAPEVVPVNADDEHIIASNHFFSVGCVTFFGAITGNFAAAFDCVSALSCEVVSAAGIVNGQQILASLDSVIYDTGRQHRGQMNCAASLRLLLEGSQLKQSNVASDAEISVFYEIPQSLGPCQEFITSSNRSLEIELNSFEMNSTCAFNSVQVEVILKSLSGALSAVESFNQSVLAALALLPGVDIGTASAQLASEDIYFSFLLLIKRITHQLKQEAELSMQYIEQQSKSVEPAAVADESKVPAHVFKKQQEDDPNMSEALRAKIEAKRKKNAEADAKKQQAKLLKKKGGASLNLGMGTSKVRDSLKETMESGRISVAFSDLFDGEKSFGVFCKELLAELGSGGCRRPKICKGARDFGPESMRIREQAFNTIRRIFKRHGGVEIDTPVFELKEVLMGKYGEDSKLIYDLADQGGELLCLRYDLTVPFARFLAMRSEGNIKRFHIAKVYRRDQPQPTKGRYREFYQCDFDIAGSYATMMPDAEVISVAAEILSELPIGKFLIKLNHRRLLDAIFEICGVPSEKFRTICSAVDKLDKEPWANVKLEMTQEKGLPEEVADRIGEFVLYSGQPVELWNKLTSMKIFGDHVAAGIAMDELKLLFEYLDAMGTLQFVSFDLSLARGLDYYTGVIYEAVLVDGTSQLGSIAAGGRYDNLVGMFSASGQQTPCVGVSIGVERVFTLMEQRANAIKIASISAIQVFIASIGAGLVPHRMKVARLLWKSNISAEFSHQDNPKFKKQLDYALEKGIPYVVVFGEEEVAKGIVKVKDIKNHTEEEVQLENVAEYLLRIGCPAMSGSAEEVQLLDMMKNVTL